MRRGQSGINALIAIDKPLGMTSHDVVSRVRRAFGERRVGHAGTLDPDASGVLVVGVGQGTRLMGKLTAERKGYLGLVVLGSETDTEDAQGSVIRTCEVPSWASDEERVREFLSGFVGDSMQVPPAYSAISVDGVRSYARARAGEDVELPARPITVYEASLVAMQVVDGNPAWLVCFDVSKGCYIRSLARDLGRAAGSAAHLGGLRRTVSGRIGIEDCVSLDDLERLGPAILESRSIDPAWALDLPMRVLSEAEAADAACGKRLAIGSCSPAAPAQGELLSVVRGGKLLGIWRREGTNLVCDTNFPDGVAGVR